VGGLELQLKASALVNLVLSAEAFAQSDLAEEQLTARGHGSPRQILA
jgi:hypothetical protein